ncbi:hypothetical protein ElyMa_003904100 [Elysia marginata]|uniref:Uncharacterized protein n=1 Tax=Elysia marginata TaxID=1093978 RepID=A0AAV4FPG2_9GAST|nr:hypothetical protein ElyMa_003904100 [Elysia marginata]
MAARKHTKIPVSEYTRNGLRNGHAPGYNEESTHCHPDHEHSITLASAYDGLVHASDIRYHYQQGDVSGGDEPFYYKPYVHLQQAAEQERHGKRAGQRLCLPWLSRGDKKILDRANEHRAIQSGSSFVATRSWLRRGASGKEELRCADCTRTSCCKKDAEEQFSDEGQDAKDICLKKYWKDFFSETSWHGCRLVVESKKRFYMR